MMIKSKKYSLYNVTSTEEAISELFNKNDHTSEAEDIPPSKTGLEIVRIQTIDNLKGITKLADYIGLNELPILQKIIISFAVIILPILIAFIYSCACSTSSKDKDKRE